MAIATKSLVARLKRLAIPAGILATVLFAFAFMFDHNRALAAASGPLDQSSVSALTALNNAVEAVAARVTPAVVNIYVTSRVKDDDQMSMNGQGINPQDLPPGFQQFFFGFGQNGQQMKPQPQFEHGVGSGFIISPDGYIVTNDHVIDGATQVRVTLNDRRVFPAKVVGVDKLNDLAVIKIDAHDLTTVPWGNSSDLRTGETVLAFGSPFGDFPFTVTRGIVSGLERRNPYSDDPRKPGDYIQTDAAINPGNSGGPLVNAYGQVIGINTFIISGSGSFAGAGFAIPSQIAETSAEDIIKTGTVHHGYLGIGINSVTPENATFFNLPDASGAIISEVTPDSPASRAGLKSGDVLRELNGKKIDNAGSFQVAVSEMAPGTQINVGVLRDGKPDTIHVTVGEFHNNSNSEEASNSGAEAQHARLGVSVSNLTADLRQQYNIPDSVNGAVIQSVRPGSPADDAGLSAGDVILGVDRHPVESADAFANQVHAAPAGKDVLLLVWANGGSSYLVVHPAQNSQSGM
jgi:serine protease Do